MNILFISQDLPTENFSGAAIRSSFIYRELSSIADVHLVTANDTGISQLHVDEFKNKSYLGHIDMSFDRSQIDKNSSRLRKKLEAITDLTGYDYLFVRYYWVACAIGLIEEKNLILDCDDCIIELADRAAISNLEFDLLRERYINHLSLVKLVFFSKKSTMIPWSKNFRIFPNCVSLPAEFPLISSSDNKTDLISKNPALPSGRKDAPFRILFVGKLNYKPNYESLNYFIENIWLKFVALRNNSLLRICGWGLPEPFRIKWVCYPNIEYCGYVDSIDDVYADVDVSISPIKTGSGTHIKIMESLIRGVPMVITVKSHRGYENTLIDGESLFVAKDDNEFIERLLELGSNPSLRRKMAENGRIKIRENYTYDRLRGRLGRMLREMNVQLSIV